MFALTLGGWGSVATLAGVIIAVVVPIVKAARRLFRAVDRQLEATRANTNAIRELSHRIEDLENGRGKKGNSRGV